MNFLSTLYKAFICPHLKYCIQAWSPYIQKDIKKLENVQRRATKLIPQLQVVPYKQQLMLLGLEKLQDRRIREDMIEVFKILSGIEFISSLPEFLSLSGGRTRGHNKKLYKQQCTTTKRLNFFTQTSSQ